MLITEEILLLTECPLLVVKEPSEEIVESGRGMISTFSEKPTRGRDPGLAGEESWESVSPADVDTERPSGGAVVSSSAGWPSGVFGRLLLSLGEASWDGNMIDMTSWLERAADRRCACPRLPPAPGTGRALLVSGAAGAVNRVGLVLSALETPNLESPPTNSLPPLLCPLRGVI